MSLADAFKRADEVLLHAVQGITDLITVHGLINVDFADVRTIMAEQGMALMGTGRVVGPNRAIEAMQAAISSPLLEDVTIDGATGLLVNITGGASLTLHEVERGGRRWRRPRPTPTPTSSSARWSTSGWTAR